ncbi:MAG: VRR-NUC domain-containing protein [Magnetococcales bacterium]|nr:VRR-NUC domain-containing protein [Magnetococcales bacterium]
MASSVRLSEAQLFQLSSSSKSATRQGMLKSFDATRHPLAGKGAVRKSRSRKSLIKVAPSEHSEQVALFEWAEISSKAIPELSLLAAIPNGGHRLKAVAGKMKAEGVKSGFPDIIFPIARGGFHGLFVEMKAPGGGTWQQTQQEWAGNLAKQGYLAVVCYGWGVAQNVLLDYISGKIQIDVFNNPAILKATKG